MDLVYFLVAFAATTIGSISGLGGGVIIKPTLDILARAQLSLREIAALSSVTVFAMAAYSSFRGMRKGVKLELRLFLPLSIAASLGGFLGNQAFSLMVRRVGEAACSRFQSIAMLLLMGAVLSLYLLGQRCKPLALRATGPVVLSGVLLGGVSSFLGIGGGPVNVVALKLLFGFEEREQVFGSLFIILFAQGSKILSIALAGEGFTSYLLPALMIAGGVLGGQTGSTLALRLSPMHIRRLFICALLLVIAISACPLLLA